MTATPSTSVKGSRLGTLFSSYMLSLAQATTHHVCGQAGSGLVIRCPGRMIGFQYSSEYAAGTNGQTHTITVYKGSVAAGNKAFETVNTQTGAAGTFSVNNTTVANAGMDVVA